MPHYILIGKCNAGRFAGQMVVVSSLKENALASTREQAEENLKRAKNYLGGLKFPEVNPDTIQIVEVDNIPELTTGNKRYEL